MHKSAFAAPELTQSAPGHQLRGDLQHGHFLHLWLFFYAKRQKRFLDLGTQQEQARTVTPLPTRTTSQKRQHCRFSKLNRQ